MNPPHLSVYMSAELLARIQEAAYLERASASAFVLRIVEEELARRAASVLFGVSEDR